MHTIFLRTAVIALFAAAGSTAANSADLFGITLGSPVTIPSCKTQNVVGHEMLDEDSIKEPCAYGGPGSVQGDMTIYEVHFARGLKPAYLKFPYINVFVENGTVQTISFDTTGYISQDLVLLTLKNKFGAPKSKRSVKYSNAFGATFTAAIAEWRLRDAVISMHGSDGLYEAGTVQAQTLAAAARDAAETKAHLDKTPHL